MKRRIILRIVFGLVIILALVLGVFKVVIPLFDTTSEAQFFEPEIQRFISADGNYTMENEYLTFTLDPYTTHFTLTTADGAKWLSYANAKDLNSNKLTVEKERLSSILTLEYMEKSSPDPKP